MATLGDLKTRLRTDLDRDDMGSGGALEAALNLAVTRAVEHWRARSFGNEAAYTPSSDSEDNVWTNERSDLVAARAKIILFRGALRDIDGSTLAEREELDAGKALFGTWWRDHMGLYDPRAEDGL